MVTSILKYDGKVPKVFFFMYIFVSQICDEKMCGVEESKNKPTFTVYNFFGNYYGMKICVF